MTCRAVRSILVLGSLVGAATLPGCAVEAGYPGDGYGGGYDYVGGVYEPYGYDYGGWDHGYRVGPPGGGDGRDGHDGRDGRDGHDGAGGPGGPRGAGPDRGGGAPSIPTGPRGGGGGAPRGGGGHGGGGGGAGGGGHR